jgi:catechol 2,3-dioxygenase-like lactoylglutathione lyase family enzyme
MAVQRIGHIGIIVQDLAAAVAFFEALGLERQGEFEADGDWVGRVIGLEGVHSSVALLGTPGGGTEIELSQFHSPPAVPGAADGPSNALGIRHVLFAVDDLDATLDAIRPHGAELVGAVENYKDMYRLCYVRGPERIIVELAERLG